MNVPEIRKGIIEAIEALAEPLSAEQLDDLQHMVGAQSHIPRREWGFRNYYNAEPDSPGERAMQVLVRLGFVVAGRRGYWHCTDAGCRAAGLNDKQTRRALDGD